MNANMLDALCQSYPGWFNERAGIEHPMYWTIEQQGRYFIVSTASGIYVLHDGQERQSRASRMLAAGIVQRCRSAMRSARRLRMRASS